MVRSLTRKYAISAHFHAILKRGAGFHLGVASAGQTLSIHALGLLLLFRGVDWLLTLSGTAYLPQTDSAGSALIIFERGNPSLSACRIKESTEQFAVVIR
jgi:hypothetical protein